MVFYNLVGLSQEVMIELFVRLEMLSEGLVETGSYISFVYSTFEMVSYIVIYNLLEAALTLMIENIIN